MKRLLRSPVLWLYAAQASGIIVPIIALPHLTNTLSRTGYAAYAFAQFMAQFGMSLSEFGVPLVAAREMGTKFGRSISAHSRYAVFHTLTLLNVALVALFVVFYAFAFSGSPLSRNVILIFSISILAPGIAPSWVFQAADKIRYYAGFMLVSRFTSLIALVLLTHSSGDVYIAACIMALTPLLAAIMMLWYIRRVIGAKYFRRTISYDRVKSALSKSLTVFSGSVFTYVFTFGTTFVLRHQMGDFAAAIYLSSDRISGAARQAFVPIVQATYNNMAVSFARKDFRRSVRLIGIATLAILTVAVSMAIFIWAIPSWVLPHILGHDFSRVSDVLRIQILTQISVGLSMAMLTLGLISTGNQDAIRIPYAVAAATHLAHVFVLSHYFGAQGAAISVLITESLVATMLAIACWRRGVFRSSGPIVPALQAAASPPSP